VGKVSGDGVFGVSLVGEVDFGLVVVVRTGLLLLLVILA
jgi:hypothetical protein